MARRICDALREAREVAGISQRELAEAVGVSQPTIHNWERDTEPSLDQLRAVEAALGLAAGQLARNAGYISGEALTPEQAISADGSLRVEDRQALLSVLASYRERGPRRGR